jgi:Carboxypeptidase regulatory-like domain/TonB dependent receptor-like, beta-barrel
MALVRVRPSSRLVHILLPIALVAAGAHRVGTQGATERTGTIEGTVSTQGGSVKLPGVVVSVRGASDEELAQQVSNEEGYFAIPHLPPARYRVRASLDGFQTVEGEAVVAPGGVANVTLDLPIAAVAEHVDVVAKSPVSDAGTLATTDTVGARETQLLAPGEGFQAALRLLSGVIQVPGGESIDGGRPNQAGVQLGSATLLDSATNLARVSLPADGIDSVSVLPNPYEVEFGRFSSGLVLIQTRRAGDKWRVNFNNLEPVLRLRRFTLLQVTGIAAWKPSFELGGPLIKNRVFLEQTGQYHYQTTDIPSRPETELKTNEWFSSLTRVDAKVSDRHSIIVADGFVPSTTKQATLGTFTPPDATVDVDDDVSHTMFTERSLFGAATAVEGTFQFHEYRTDVASQGSAPMELLPETTLGNFFNLQHRNTATYQWIETATHSYKGVGGIHLFKVGFDLLHNRYEGTSASRPVLIERSDGTLARRLDFDGPSVESVHSTDFALFAQDRFQPTSRWYIEFGGRVDRDGITSDASATPRVGVAVLLNDSGTATLHGGYGLFYERTPSIAAAVQQFEQPIDTRFATDGLTPLGPPIPYEYVTAPDLQTARSATWDISYDYRVNRWWSLHLGVLDRQGSHELIVDPVQTEQRGAYILSSSGRSSYRQEEVAVHFVRGQRVDVNTSYVHSSAHEDLNTLISFFDAILQPIIGANAYAPAAADAPNRFLLRGRAMPTTKWLLLGTVDWRSGLPYSIVNEDLEFVGPRNELRFPTYFRVDAGFERRLTVSRFHPWLGLRVSNALNSFLPSDVQANIGSPEFGGFYNSVYREYRIHVRFEK